MAKKTAIVNVQNNDNRCFGYAIAAAPANIAVNIQRTLHYNHLFKTFKIDLINYPVEVSDVPAIEVRLEIGINVSSFFDDEGKGR